MSAADHEDGICLGVWGSCEVCDALFDEARARRIKDAMTACGICDKPTGGPPYCPRCDDKRETIRMERLYDRMAGSE